MNPFNKDRKQLSLFITAGYPELNSLPNQIDKLIEKGVDFIEIGMPFSDPLADGPIIQSSSNKAIRNGMNLGLLFEQLESINSDVPIVLMGYANTVIQYGLDHFLLNCQNQQIASVILPDISFEIYNRLYKDQFEAYGVPITFLITPESTVDYIQQVSEYCSNSFLYLVSSNSTTGKMSNSFDAVQLNKLQRIKDMCGSTPVFIGFGIQSKSDIEKVQSISDGAIIGSAYINAIQSNYEDEFLEEICT